MAGSEAERLLYRANPRVEKADFMPDHAMRVWNHGVYLLNRRLLMEPQDELYLTTNDLSGFL